MLCPIPYRKPLFIQKDEKHDNHPLCKKKNPPIQLAVFESVPIMHDQCQPVVGLGGRSISLFQYSKRLVHETPSPVPFQASPVVYEKSVRVAKQTQQLTPVRRPCAGKTPCKPATRRCAARGGTARPCPSARDLPRAVATWHRQQCAIVTGRRGRQAHPG